MANKTTKEKLEEWLGNIPDGILLNQIPTVEKLSINYNLTGSRLPEVEDVGYEVTLVLQTETWSEKDE